MDQTTILIVDDDEIVLKSFAKILLKADYTVFAVNSGKEALKILKEQPINIVLTDLIMENMNGISILKEVKKISPDTDVIMITGYGSKDNIIESLRENVTDFLLKPCTNSDLLNRVKTVLNNQINRQLAGETKILKKMVQMLGTIAHEINNPLTIIYGNTQILQLDYPDKPELHNILKASKKIKEVLKEMQELRGVKTKSYTKNSKIIDLQKNNMYIVPQKKKVLVVDDEDMVRKVICNMLKRNNFQVDSANCAADALKKIQSCNYSIIILDICMPEVDGYQTLQLINEYYTGKKIRIPVTIMYSGYETVEIAKKCKKMGAFSILQKPLDYKTFIKAVKEAEDFSNS